MQGKKLILFTAVITVFMALPAAAKTQTDGSTSSDKTAIIVIAAAMIAVIIGIIFVTRKKD